MKSDKALFELMGCPLAGLGMMITLAVGLTGGVDGTGTSSAGDHLECISGALGCSP